MNLVNVAKLVVFVRDPSKRRWRQSLSSRLRQNQLTVKVKLRYVSVNSFGLDLFRRPWQRSRSVSFSTATRLLGTR